MPAKTLIRLLVLTSLAWWCPGYVMSQIGNIDASQFSLTFKESQVEFKRNEIISNPLRVKNTSSREVRFYIEANLPPGWSTLGSSSRTYTIGPGDSLFIPFRAVPKGNLVGNTKYALNIMVRAEDDLPLGAASFYCYTKKIVKWEMSVLPEDQIYFRNGEDISKFHISMLNTGNYAQDFQLTLNGGQREDLLLMDTNDNIVRTPSYTLPLEANEDTTLSFKVQPSQFRRNARTVSLVSHRPMSELEERRFRFYAISEEARQMGGNSMKKGTKVDFIKLANEKTVSPYRSDHLPLIAEAQIQNIMSDYSFMALNLRGIKQIDQHRRLMYFTQLYYSQSYFNNNQFNDIPWYIGYFDKKWDLQAGLVSGRALGVRSSGKGFMGSYQVFRDHRIGGHVTQAPGILDNAQVTSFGLYHDYMGTGRIRVSSTLARSEDKQQGINANVASSRVSIRVASGHNLNLLGAYSIRQYTDTAVQQNGYMAGATYSGVMMNKRLRSTLNGRYNTPTFGTGTSERISGNNRTTYDFNDVLQVQLLNNFNSMNRYANRFADTAQYNYQTIFNRLNFSMRTPVGVFQPGIFYDITRQVRYTNHFRGVSFTYSRFDFESNALYSSSVKLGYNNPLEYPEIKEYFTAQLSFLARVKTFTFNMRYNYGPSNPLVLLNSITGSTYPQQFRGSVQHQYMFRNTRFILQTGGNYSYSNQINSHTLAFFPELFYFTTTGWRFSVNCNYSFTSSNFQKATANVNPIRRVENESPSATISHSVRFGATIRKEFGIPIPFTKSQNFDMNFVAFYDLNGNGIHDRDEPTIENVVIRIANEEVITNLHGKAALKNMPKGAYAFIVIPLDAPEGWFAEVPDSLFVNMNKVVPIPFVRGIKVFGKVVMDRDKLVTGADERFDLSNIKITAMNGKTYHTLTGFDGGFEFYLPNGTYTISVDENVLTDRFRLLQNNIPVTLDRDLDNIFVSFFIIEKRRKVNIKRFEQEE